MAGKISIDYNTFVNPNHTKTRSAEKCAKDNLENSIDTPQDFPRASECAQMNLKTRFGKATKSTVFDAKRTEDAVTAVKSEIVILDLLSCGLSGGKVGRAWKILENQQNWACFHQHRFWKKLPTRNRHKIGNFGFFSDAQIPFEKIDDLSLDLVRL